MAKALPVVAVNPHGLLSENAGLVLHTRLLEMLRYQNDVVHPERVDELHHMRIAAKRLRYSMEVFAPCFTTPDFEEMYSAVKTIQEHIGDIHDFDVRVPLLQAHLDSEGQKNPEIREGIESLINRERSEREQGYQAFLAYWQGLQQQNFQKRFLEMLVALETGSIGENNGP